MGQIINMSPQESLPLPAVNKDALKKAETLLHDKNLPQTINLPENVELTYHQDYAKKPITQLLLADGYIYFIGKLDRLPILNVAWKISRISKYGKVYASPSVNYQENPALHGTNLDLPKIFGYQEQFIGDIGELEKTQKAVDGEYVQQYKLKSTVRDIRRKLAETLENHSDNQD